MKAKYKFVWLKRLLCPDNTATDFIAIELQRNNRDTIKENRWSRGDSQVTFLPSLYDVTESCDVAEAAAMKHERAVAVGPLLQFDRIT